MSSREKPLPKSTREFVEFHLAETKKDRRGVFGAFTGTDHTAWNAFVYLVQLYGRTGFNERESVIVALRAVVAVAQRSVLAMFKKAIPGILDWSDERTLWTKIAPSAPLSSIDTDFARALGARAHRVVWPCEDGERVCTHAYHDTKPPNPKRPRETLECPDCGVIFILVNLTNEEEQLADELAWKSDADLAKWSVTPRPFNGNVNSAKVLDLEIERRTRTLTTPERYAWRQRIGIATRTDYA